MTFVIKEGWVIRNSVISQNVALATISSKEEGLKNPHICAAKHRPVHHKVELPPAPIERLDVMGLIGHCFIIHQK
jgi:hypothetical protein